MSDEESHDDATHEEGRNSVTVYFQIIIDIDKSWNGW